MKDNVAICELRRIMACQVCNIHLHLTDLTELNLVFAKSQDVYDCSITEAIHYSLFKK